MAYTVTKTETATVKQAAVNMSTTFVANGYLSAATATFITKNVKFGDRAILAGSTSNDGEYVIKNVLSETELIVDNTFNAEAVAGTVQVKQNNYYLTITDETLPTWTLINTNCPLECKKTKMKGSKFLYEHVFDYINVTHTGATTSTWVSEDEVVVSKNISDTAPWDIRCLNTDNGKTILRLGNKGVCESDILLPDTQANMNDGGYFTFTGISGSGIETYYYGWFDKVGDGSGDPAPAGLTEVRIDISGDTTANDVRDTMIGVIDALDQFSSTAYLGYAVITRINPNAVPTTAADVDSGAVVFAGGIVTGTGDRYSVTKGCAYWGYAPGGYSSNYYDNLITQYYASMLKGSGVHTLGKTATTCGSIIDCLYAYFNYYNYDTDMIETTVLITSSWGFLAYSDIESMDNILLADSGNIAPIVSDMKIEGFLKSTFCNDPLFWILTTLDLIILNPKEPYTTNELFSNNVMGATGQIQYTWKPKFVYLNEITKDFVPLEDVHVSLYTIETGALTETEIAESPMMTDANGYLINGSDDYIDLIAKLNFFFGGAFHWTYHYRCTATIEGFRKLEWIFDINEKQEDVEIVMTKLGTDFEGEFST